MLWIGVDDIGEIEDMDGVLKILEWRDGYGSGTGWLIWMGVVKIDDTGRYVHFI